jgi:hypothetical protein
MLERIENNNKDIEIFSHLLNKMVVVKKYLLFTIMYKKISIITTTTMIYLINVNYYLISSIFLMDINK